MFRSMVDLRSDGEGGPVGQAQVRGGEVGSGSNQDHDGPEGEEQHVFAVKAGNKIPAALEMFSSKDP